MRELNEELEKFMEDYDTWLYQQADEYMDPHVSEIKIKGYSYFDIKVKKPDGEIIEMYNIPLSIYKNIDISDDYPRARWSDIEDNIEDYIDLSNLKDFDPYVEEVESELLPEDWELVEIIDYADGHNYTDFEVE